MVARSARPTLAATPATGKEAMHVAHAIVGHAVSTLIMLSALGVLFVAIFRLDKDQP